ncbi:MAG: NAD(P)-dependent oxidoreductase [Anaerolineales bacterium]|nr:NAD(P)-dependent oxidoreductase [Anaerolineales bacterium]
MKIAVTGGNGDLGRVLVPYLVEQGHAVVNADRTLPNPPHTRPVVANLVIDARNYGEVVSALRDCDAVVHLAAYRHPMSNPDYVVHNENVAMNYNVLSAAATLGIKRVCLASSINAIGGAFSRTPRYDYFPVDEHHPTYAEDPYSLSKWLGEQQADAFVRRYEQMTVASLRFHGLVHQAEKSAQWPNETMMRHLWAYTLLPEAARACLLALTADFIGHEVFYIVAPKTRVTQPSRQLAEQYYPNTPIRSEFAGHAGFFDCRKAERILGWVHQE